MKYIITENQQERMRKRIFELLNYEVRESNVICKIEVLHPDEEENDYEIEKGLKYDIIVYLNESFTRTGGIYGFKIATEKKLKRLLLDWFGLGGNEYSIWTLVREC